MNEVYTMYQRTSRAKTDRTANAANVLRCRVRTCGVDTNTGRGNEKIAVLGKWLGVRADRSRLAIGQTARIRELQIACSGCPTTGGAILEDR